MYFCIFFLFTCLGISQNIVKILYYLTISLKFVAGVLHTILFHRALGLVRPKDVDCELFEITYVSSFQS